MTFLSPEGLIFGGCGRLDAGGFRDLFKNEGTNPFSVLFLRENDNAIVDIKAIIQLLRDQGRVVLKDRAGHVFELINSEQWADVDGRTDGIYLLFDLFQIRSIAVPFSDISLDVVDFSTKPVIYHTLANPHLLSAPIKDGQVRFAMIKEGSWNKLLFNFGKSLIYQAVADGRSLDFDTVDKFPIVDGEVKQMFLGPEGEVKILNG